jgi:hypothetical protein
MAEPRPRRPLLPVQRYISAEHKAAGEAATTKTITLALWAGGSAPPTTMKTVTVSYGDANALLDYYENWQQLKKAPAPEVERLVALFNQERDARAAGKSGPSEGDYEAATVGRKSGAGQAGAATKTYLELAEENVAHFTPDNRERYRQEHKEALKRGIDAFNLRAKGKPAEADAAAADAFLVNASADHYLEDAFAAGHLVSKPLIQLATVEFWRGGIGQAAGDHLKAAAARDQARVWQEIERNVLPHRSDAEQFALQHMDRNRAIGRVIDRILDRLQGQPDKIANLGAKLVHDHLNTTGVQVFSEADPTTGWRTFGDNFMAKGATQAHVVAAVKESVGNVESAVADGLSPSGGKPADIDAFLKTHDPWRLAPKWAEIPAGVRREVGTAFSDKKWVQDLLETLIFRDDVAGPLYQLLIENLQLIDVILTAEEQATSARRTAQAADVDKLLKKFSKNFAAGGRPDDVNVGALARVLDGKPPDLLLSVLDALDAGDTDDDLEQALTEQHTDDQLSRLDTAVLLGLRAAMQGGITWGGEVAQISRLQTALSVKTGKRLVGQLPAGARKAGNASLAALGAAERTRVAASDRGTRAVLDTRRQVFQAKELATDLKGKDPAVILGAIETIFVTFENAVWLQEFAALHTDAELGALDVAVLEAMSKELSGGKQRTRVAKALKDAKARGVTSSVVADDRGAAAIVHKRKFEDYPRLAKALKGKDGDVVRAALESVTDDDARSKVTTDYVNLHSDAELVALPSDLLHSMASFTHDATAQGRVSQALLSRLKEAATRTAV